MAGWTWKAAQGAKKAQKPKPGAGKPRKTGAKSGKPVADSGKAAADDQKKSSKQKERTRSEPEKSSEKKAEVKEIQAKESELPHEKTTEPEAERTEEGSEAESRKKEEQQEPIRQEPSREMPEKKSPDIVRITVSEKKAPEAANTEDVADEVPEVIEGETSESVNTESGKSRLPGFIYPYPGYTNQDHRASRGIVEENHFFYKRHHWEDPAHPKYYCRNPKQAGLVEGISWK